MLRVPRSSPCSRAPIRRPCARTFLWTSFFGPNPRLERASTRGRMASGTEAPLHLGRKSAIGAPQNRRLRASPGRQKGTPHAGLLRSRLRHQSHQGQEDRHRRLRQPGPRPCAEPARFRGQERRRRAARGVAVARQGRGRGPSGHVDRRNRRLGGRADDDHARRAAGRDLPRAHPRQPPRRRRHRLRPRPQHPFRPDRAEARRRRHHDGPEGPRPHRARRVRQGRRRALPRRGGERRERLGDGGGEILLRRDRRRALGDHRDRLQGGVRDRPLRRAGGALRRPRRADPHGLRDAGRGRLRARDGLFRVPPRGEADRRPHLRGRHRQHELLDLQHRRVRRVRLGAAHPPARGDQGAHEGRARGHPVRALRARLDGENARSRRPSFKATRAQQRRSPDRGCRREACAT
jgi:hypothetical protein